MANKFSISLEEAPYNKLEKICKEKGLAKSAAIAIAIDLYYKKENPNES